MLYYSIFQQLFKLISRYRFDQKSDETSGNRCCKHFSAWRQFLTCLYAQITGKDPLREIASGLPPLPPRDESRGEIGPRRCHEPPFTGDFPGAF